MAEQLIHSLQFPGLPDTYVIPEVGRNLLDNACFVGGGSQQGGKQLPINSRGLTQYSTYENPVPQRYFIDRWIYPNTLSVSIQNDSIRITNNNAQLTGIYQQCSQTFPAKQMIFSCLINTHNAGSDIRFLLGHGPYLNNYLNVSPSDEDEWQLITLLSDPEDSVNRVEIDFMSSSTGYIDIRAVKLEFGTEQTLAHKENDIWILNEIPDYEFELLRCKTATVDSSDIYANNLNIADKNYCRNNLLRNWYFVGGGSQQGDRQFPINSRGLTTYTGNATFTIDRWWMRNTYNTGVPTVNVLSDGIQIIADGGSAQGFNQSVEGFRNLAGKTVTASLLITQNTFTSGSYPYFGLWNSTTVTTNNTTVKAISLAGQGTGLFTFTVTLPQNWTNNYLNIGIYFSTYVGSIKVSAMKLELGTQQTLAHLENGEWVLNEVPNYEEELIKCQTAASDPGQDPYAHNLVSINVPNPNLLDNWYFIGGGSQLGAGIFPINQRGQTSYTAAGYCIDRWYSQRTTHTLTLQSGCIHWERVTNGSFNPLFYQPIKVVQGGVYTYSILYRTTFRSVRETFTSTLLPEASDWTLYTKTATVSGASANIGVQDISYNQGLDDTGKYIEIKAMKLEVGTQQTLAHMENGAWVMNEIPDYWKEISTCQRYLKTITAWTNIYAIRVDNNNVYFFIPGQMAQNPSTLSSQAVYIYSSSGTNYSTTENITFTAQSDGVMGQFARGSVPGGSYGSLTFSANAFISSE